MVSSIRWRLQLWYGLVLLAVVAGFAGLLYYRVRQGRLAEIDAGLIAGARALEGMLRGLPPQAVGAAPREGDRPPPRRQGDAPPPRERDLPPDRPPPPERLPPRGPGRLLAELRLPEDLGRGGPPYFAVWRADGSLLRRSPDFDPAADEGPPPPRDWRGQPYVVSHDSRREAVLAGPHGTRVLVGRPVGREMAELTALAGQLLGVGCLVLAIGLLGGWLISSRIVRPIADISATAAAISAADLSRRIDTGPIDRELAELGNVLNATFDRLQAAFERQVRFTADASHELRTPLAIIRTQAELTLTRPRSAAEYREAIETCLRAARRMTALVEALLTLARADAGRLDLQAGPVDLCRVVEESADLVRPLAMERGLALTLDCEPLRVLGDAGRLTQVVTNLLSNAIQYNRRDGSIRVGLHPGGGEVILEVADTGCGISAEDQAHLFERFYRVDRARTRVSGGHGLGLAICKSIVEAHGGVIACESTVGAGATFRVRLPVNPAPTANEGEMTPIPIRPPGAIVYNPRDDTRPCGTGDGP